MLVAGRVIAKVTNQPETPKETQTKIVETIPSTPEPVKVEPEASVEVTEPIKPVVVEPVDTNACLVAMRQIFPAETWSIGEAIMRAESGLNPNAVSPTNDYGCWQIHDWELYDPLENTKVAYYKYTHYGWTPWSVWNSGSYRRFL